METITTEQSLKDAIAALEIKHAREQAALKAQLQTTYDKLTPASLLHSAVEEISSKPEVQAEMIRAAATLATGYVARRVVEKLSKDHPRDKELGSALLTGATVFIAQNPEVIRTVGNAFFAMLRKARGK